MSYQVLARKYRPKSFAEMVGQEHVLRALVNALDNNRLHHAYLFTGTRGVGKTSLARLLAKCLNCEAGISSKPCEVCTTCQEITAGHFVDLIEVDAASRTKVEDTRELLDNVQYAPARGRYKIYLIDEVHMLSGHSFNALLKTLEEPPPHVKFLLATTDPQRLPITILSRCLQFNLKNLTSEKIQKQLENILQLENINFELPALSQLARAANGSLRDALSLLDQAIAYGGGQVNESDVRAMLGTIEQKHIFDLVDALAQQNPQQMIEQVNQLAEQSIDFANALEELNTLFHHIALAQTVPGVIDERFNEADKIKQLAQQFTAEDIQLFYQIALIGRRDLPLAPSTRIGFEMTLLRMFAFTPTGDQSVVDKNNSKVTVKASNIASSTPNKSQLLRGGAGGESSINCDQQFIESRRRQDPAPPNPQAANNITNSSTAISSLPNNTDEWTRLIPQLNLSGFTLALATNCALKTHIDGFLQLEIDPSQSALLNPKQEARLTEALSAYFNKPIKLQITTGSPNLNTPARNKQQQQAEQLQAATAAIHSDNNVQHIIKTFNARIDPDSIQSKNPAMLSSDEN